MRFRSTLRLLPIVLALTFWYSAVGDKEIDESEGIPVGHSMSMKVGRGKSGGMGRGGGRGGRSGHGARGGRAGFSGTNLDEGDSPSKRRRRHHNMLGKGRNAPDGITQISGRALADLSRPLEYNITSAGYEGESRGTDEERVYNLRKVNGAGCPYTARYFLRFSPWSFSPPSSSLSSLALLN
jgi:hypothetical protein